MQGAVDVYDTIALTISANDDQIVGRTTLQKLVYFEKVKFPEIQVGPYTAYFYGPFSRDVAKSLENMVILDMLDERRIRHVHSSYQYIVTQKGIPTINRLL